MSQGRIHFLAFFFVDFPNAVGGLLLFGHLSVIC